MHHTNQLKFLTDHQQHQQKPLAEPIDRGRWQELLSEAIGWHLSSTEAVGRPAPDIIRPQNVSWCLHILGRPAGNHHYKRRTQSMSDQCSQTSKQWQSRRCIGERIASKAEQQAVFEI